MNDVDMTGIDFMPIAYNTVANDNTYEGTAFSGSINGNGNEISNLTITFNNRYIGLIAYTTANARLNNIALTNINIDNAEHFTGGLVGRNGGTITRSYTTGTVDKEILDIISDIGGLVGHNRGTITNSYSNVEVNGNNNIGGFVGFNRGTILNSYATGIIPDGRGFIGFNGNNSLGRGTVTNSYWYIGSSGRNASGGEDLTNNNYTGVQSANTIADNGGTYQASLKTGEDQQNNPTYTIGDVFVGWDFNNVWEFREGQWPILRGIEGQE